MFVVRLVVPSRETVRERLRSEGRGGQRGLARRGAYIQARQERREAATEGRARRADWWLGDA